MYTRFVYRHWLTICCCFCLAGGVGGASWWIYQTKQGFLLANRPPNQVFTSIFQIPVPSGVSKMKVAGIASISGTFWMRFQSKNVNAVLKALENNPKVPVGGPMSAADASYLPSPREIAQDHYSSVVGWSEVSRIKRPEYYVFSPVPQWKGWFGALVVDREKNTIYAYGNLL